jgi:flagellar assembly protein FliH
MPTSKPPLHVPPPAGTASNSYTRFIPREELGTFAAWHPDSLQEPGQIKPAPGESPSGGGIHKPSLAERASAQVEKAGAQSPGQKAFVEKTATKGKPAVAPQAKPESPAQVVAVEKAAKEARQMGYQDGYRDGLAALESYKQTQAAQMAAFLSEHVGAVVSEMHVRLEMVEQQLSGRIAGVALELARQVVRTEITVRPELVVAVAEEALTTLLDTAKHVTVRMNPQDLAMTNGLLQERLLARGARTVPDANILAGGCMVESDIAAVDATVQARWQHAASAMGLKLAWADHDHPPVPEVEDDVDQAADWPHGAGRVAAPVDQPTSDEGAAP